MTGQIDLSEPQRSHDHKRNKVSTAHFAELFSIGLLPYSPGTAPDQTIDMQIAPWSGQAPLQIRTMPRTSLWFAPGSANQSIGFICQRFGRTQY